MPYCDPPASIHEDRVMLERFNFAFQQTIPDVILREAVSIEALRDDAVQCLVYRLRYEILGHELNARIVSYPADWWQAFRLRWFPAWWLSRWPVRYTEERIRLLAFYPQIPIDQRPVYHVAIGQNLGD
ncbi:hypothetical protein LCGC14_1560710 [marine sediment metagenome]|uniref:Uncharacterized protein n=1 Tax=marine sediment metagenome TaxID=412755 RepID=A0A0F9J8L2_9ZZZZ